MNQHYPVPYYYYPATSVYHQAYSGKYLEQGKFGAMVGFIGAGATNLRRLQRAEIDGGQALTGALKSGLYAGLATAAAGMAADRFQSPTLSLLATVAAGTAVMYALNSVSEEGPHE